MKSAHTAAGFEHAFANALFDHGAPGPGGVARQPAFAVYRNTVMKGCVDALTANFPSVARLVGDEWFAAAAAIYVRQHPPSTPVLLEYGDGLAEFLREFPPAAELTYLGDVALLDRLWTECHIAGDAPPLSPDALTQLTPDAVAACVLHPHPAARWRYFRECPAFSIWSSNRETAPTSDAQIEWQAEGALLTRPHDHVRWIQIDAAGCAFLDHCAAGENLASATEACLSIDPHADLRGLMAMLLQQGALKSMTSK